MSVQNEMKIPSGQTCFEKCLRSNKEGKSFSYKYTVGKAVPKRGQRTKEISKATRSTNYHMTRTDPRAISLENHKKKSPVWGPYAFI